MFHDRATGGRVGQWKADHAAEHFPATTKFSFQCSVDNLVKPPARQGHDSWDRNTMSFTELSISNVTNRSDGRCPIHWNKESEALNKSFQPPISLIQSCRERRGNKIKHWFWLNRVESTPFINIIFAESVVVKEQQRLWTGHVLVHWKNQNLSSQACSC